MRTRGEDAPRRWRQQAALGARVAQSTLLVNRHFAPTATSANRRLLSFLLSTYCLLLLCTVTFTGPSLY